MTKWALFLFACAPQGAWSDLPVFTEQRYERFSSAQRDTIERAFVDPGNKDFNTFIARCPEDARPLLLETTIGGDCAEAGRVLARVDGASGWVSRLWLTAAIALGPPSLDGPERIAIYVDGKLLRDASFAELGEETSGAVLSYEPIEFRDSLLVVGADFSPNKVYYYLIDVQTAKHPLPQGAPVFGPANRKGAALDVVGPGTIEWLQLTLPIASLEETRVVAIWDDEAAIDLPVATLFGLELGAVSYDSAAMSSEVQGDDIVLTLRLPMPFAKHARVDAGGAAIAARIVQSTPNGPYGKLRAVHAESKAPLVPWHDVANLQGRGKLVGVQLTMQGRTDRDALLLPHPYNFLEGDDVLTLDGRVLQGTGTEDYFGGGFYFASGPFHKAYVGLTHATLAGESGAISVYRWHVLADSISFAESLRLGFEMGVGHANTIDRYSSVAWYYVE